MKYSLIAVDLDGTLLNAGKQISEEDMAAIAYAGAQGVRVVISSGRIYAGAKVYAGEAGLSGPLISCNGALIMDTSDDSVIYINPIERAEALRAAALLKSMDIYFHVYVGDTLYGERLAYGLKAYVEKNHKIQPSQRINIQVCENILDVLQETAKPILKLVAVSEDRALVRKARSLMEAFGTLSVTSSGDDNFEVLAQGTGKGEALQLLCEQLEISRSEVAAIGDNENDLSMLEFAETAVAMGNALPEIQQKAAYITGTCNESGVAQAIYTLLNQSCV